VYSFFVGRKRLSNLRCHGDEELLQNLDAEAAVARLPTSRATTSYDPRRVPAVSGIGSDPGLPTVNWADYTRQSLEILHPIRSAEGSS
jgi:hypothetical protein